MHDLIDIVEEFNEKFLKLLYTLIKMPWRIIESLRESSNVYIKPFRFFSYISSTTLLIIVFLNRFDLVTFWSVKYALPSYWEAYYQSMDEVAITLFPVLGFFFIIAIFSLLTSFLFRASKFSFQQHLSFIFYQAGTLLIYYLLAIGVIILFEDLIQSVQVFEFLLYIFLFLVPVIFIIWTQWNLGGLKLLRPVKSVSIILLTGLIFSSFYYDIELDRIANDFFLYKKDRQHPLVRETTPVSKTRLFEDTEEFYLLPVNTESESNEYLIGLWDFNDENVQVKVVSETLEDFAIIDEDVYDWITFYNFEEQSYAIVQADTNSVIYNQLWQLSTEKSKLIVGDSILFNYHSKMIKSGDKLLLSGTNKESQASLFQVLSDSLKLIVSLNESNTSFGYLVTLNDSILFSIAGNQSNGSLNRIYINRINLETLELEKEISLFENRLVSLPPLNHLENYPTYNPWLSISKDSTAIFIVFQLMTEKTFELQLYKLDLELNLIKQSFLHLPAHLSYFYSYVLDEQHLYVFGRSFTLIPASFSGTEASYPFIAKFSLVDLSLLETIDLEPLVPMYKNRKLYGGTEYQLYMYRTKMEVSEGMINLLMMNEQAIDRIRIPINGSE